MAFRLLIALAAFTATLTLANCASALPGSGHDGIDPPSATGDYLDDTLYLYAPQPLTSVGEPVTVIAATGRPAHALQFLTSVSVTIDAQGAYVPDSFSVGEPGGGRLGVDGLWGEMSIPADHFLDLGDAFMPGPGPEIGNGRRAYEFAIVTMGPYPAADAAGVLFSFQLTFDQPGTYKLGLRQTDGTLDMTYYADADGVSHMWGALLADTNGDLNSDIPDYSNVIVVE